MFLMLEYQKSSPAPIPSPKSASDVASLVWWGADVFVAAKITQLEIYPCAIPHVRNAPHSKHTNKKAT
jgi:hypothetical protein